MLERKGRRELLGNRDQLARRFAAVGVGGERFDQTLGRDRAGQEVRGAGAHGVDGLGDRLALGSDDDRQAGTLGPQRGNSGRARFVVPIGKENGLNFAAMGPLKQPDGSLDAIGTDRDPAAARRDCGDEPSLGWVGFDQQQGFCFLLAHRSSSASPREKE